jgi:cytochrome c biogenesis protein CcdA
MNWFKKSPPKPTEPEINLLNPTPPAHWSPVLWTVILTGFDPAFENKIPTYVDKTKYTFPMVGWVIGLNSFGQPIVMPIYPARSVASNTKISKNSWNIENFPLSLFHEIFTFISNFLFSFGNNIPPKRFI